MGSNQRNNTTQFLLLTIPRSGCHLLDRMLSKQSNGHYILHPYLNCMEPRLQWLHSENPLDGMSAELSEKHEAESQKGLHVWKKGMEEAEVNGKILMNHTHPFHAISLDIIKSHISSPDKLPMPSDGEIVKDAEQLLLHAGTFPVFTIRDPRLVVASGSRLLAGPMGFSINTPTLSSVSPFWSRTLYDWFVSHGIKPLIVDADDYMTSSEFVRKLCREAGLNEDEAWLQWDAGTKKENMRPEMEPMWESMQKTLHNSQGSNPGRAAKNMDMDAEVGKWKEEFGEEAEKSMLEAVRLQMPHYEYLHERRLTL